eukprot:scaffold20625_cov59-Phaeocystis_antarctica.AAC.2
MPGASQRGRAWDRVVVIVAASAVLGDAVLFRVKHVVSQRRRKPERPRHVRHHRASVALGSGDHGLVSKL